MDNDIWVGKEEHGGVPSLARPDAPKAKGWSLLAIAGVERPHDARVSPDGSNVAFILDRDTSDVWTIDINGERLSRMTTGRDLSPFWEDDAATWSPDGSRLAYSDEGAVWVVPVGGGLPTKIAEGSSPVWIDSDELIISIEGDQKGRLARVTVDDPAPLPITSNESNVAGASVAPGHRALVYVEFPGDDRQSSNIWMHDLDNGQNLQVTDTPGMHDHSARLSPDGSTVAFTSERSGWYETYVVATDGSGLRQITNGDADFSGLEWHPDGTRILAVRTKRGRDDLVVIDPKDGGVTVLAAGGTWSSAGWCQGGVVAVYEDHATPPRLVKVVAGHDPETLFSGTPASVASAKHVAYDEVSYQSFDGMEIHGFLFRPESSPGDRLPTIVYPHGGPTSAYGDEWDGHAQYFVAKGYAWLAINFRGSTGYGRDFERANHGVWGVADTEDCLAAADYLAGLDWIDPDRIGIFGASYGSYMALASLTNDPQHRFACGVAKYGDSDIATSWAQGDRGGREDLERMMGTPAENRKAYRDGSPLNNVANIERPILVAHGERDLRVHRDQSEQLVAELRRTNKVFEYVTYPTEGHGLLRTGPQVHFYERLERFLDWYLM